MVTRRIFIGKDVEIAAKNLAGIQKIFTVSDALRRRFARQVFQKEFTLGPTLTGGPSNALPWLNRFGRFFPYTFESDGRALAFALIA